MALESMTGMLQKARKNAYAVGAFNILDYNSIPKFKIIQRFSLWLSIFF